MAGITIQATLTSTLTVTNPISRVWAALSPLENEPAAPGNTLLPGSRYIVTLTAQPGQPDVYTATANRLNGPYRIVIYAQDVNGMAALPKHLERVGGVLHLPYVQK